LDPTALIDAAKAGNLAVVQDLLSRGVQQRRSAAGDTALHAACRGLAETAIVAVSGTDDAATVRATRGGASGEVQCNKGKWKRLGKRGVEGRWKV
jgi:hypothetical protein